MHANDRLFRPLGQMGDGVDDTPAHSGPSWDIKEGRATCWQSVAVDSCNATAEPASPGIDVGVDPGKMRWLAVATPAATRLRLPN